MADLWYDIQFRSSSSSSVSISSSSQSINSSSSSCLSSSSSSLSSSSLSSSSQSATICGVDTVAAYFEQDNVSNSGALTFRTVILDSFLLQSASKIRLIIENTNTGGNVTEMWVGHASGVNQDFDGNQQQVFVGGSGSFYLSGGGYQTVTDEITINFNQNTDFIISLYTDGTGNGVQNYIPFASNETGCNVYLAGGNLADDTNFSGSLSDTDTVLGCTAICVTENPA